MAFTATSPEIFISSVSKKIKADSSSMVKFNRKKQISLRKTPNPFNHDEIPQFKSITIQQDLGIYPTFEFKSTFDSLTKEIYNDNPIEDELHPNLANVFSVRCQQKSIQKI